MLHGIRGLVVTRHDSHRERRLKSIAVFTFGIDEAAGSFEIAQPRKRLCAFQPLVQLRARLGWVWHLAEGIGTFLVGAFERLMLRRVARQREGVISLIFA